MTEDARQLVCGNVRDVAFLQVIGRLQQDRHASVDVCAHLVVEVPEHFGGHRVRLDRLEREELLLVRRQGAEAEPPVFPLVDLVGQLIEPAFQLAGRQVQDVGRDVLDVKEVLSAVQEVDQSGLPVEHEFTNR
ncbi:hypothetical protein [Lentzea terrae]|uniref:hypothetical protein n=1 Tax=Lentzea terrae TaxID=2200761 RepID=UPI001E2B1238|nr:hypothetical protein [Lentzea terrae]